MKWMLVVGLKKATLYLMYQSELIIKMMRYILQNKETKMEYLT